ncbi:MAG: DUF3592 domain-containing protein, partial [Verrucomicrobiales bacterium]
MERDKKPSGLGVIGMSMKRFFLIFCLLIGAALAIEGVRQMQDSRRSSGWPSVKGTIIKSNLSSSLQPDANQNQPLKKRYKAEIEYLYDVGETTYRAQMVAYGMGASFNQSAAAAVTAKYPTGRLVTVYYKPGDPATAVLEPGLNRKAILLPIGGVLLFFAGLFGLIAAAHQ